MEMDIVTAAALVAVLVGVAKGQGMPAKYSQPASILIATVYVLIPDAAQQIIATIAAVGLGSAGAYSLTKKGNTKQ